MAPLTGIRDAVAEGVGEMGFSTGAFWAGTVPVGMLALSLPFSSETMEEVEAWGYERGVVGALRKAYAELKLMLPVQP